LILAGFDHAEIAKSPNFMGILRPDRKKRPIHRVLSDPSAAKTRFCLAKSGLFRGRQRRVPPQLVSGFGRRSRVLDFNRTRSYLTGPEDVQEMRGFTGA
jgi:hypothetical protein